VHGVSDQHRAINAQGQPKSNAVEMTAEQIEATARARAPETILCN